MKAVTPKQLELTAGTHIDPESPALKESIKKVERIELAEVAEAVLAQAGPPSRDPDDFDWNNDDSIVLREQPATAIYHNRHGVLVIRQKADWDAESDTFAFITPENAVRFMEALAKVARE